MKIKDIKKIKKTWAAVKYVFRREKSGRKYAALKIILSLVGTILPLVFVVFPGKIINELNTENIDYRELFLYLSVLTIYPLVWYFIKYFIGRKIEKYSSEFNIHSNEMVLNHLAKIDFEDLETPNVQQLRGRADSAMGRLLSIIDLYCNVLASVVGFIAICSIISSLSPFIIILIIVLVLFNTMAAKWLQKKKRESKLRADILNREKMTYCYAFDDIWFAKEMRLFQSQDFLIKKMSENEKETNKNHLKYIRDEGAANVVPVISSFFQQIVVYVYLFFLVIKKGLQIGSMTIYLAAVSSLYNSINSLSKSYISLIGTEYDLDDILDYFSINLRQISTGTDSIDNAVESIEFKNVSFKYPGSDRYALENVSIIINKNEHLCIVGENGAGKSTFINLLTRLYFPTSGEILINGKNIYDYDYYEYISLFSPVFQDFCKYEFEVKNNICLSTEIDDVKLENALSNLSLMPLINKLPKKENTFIGKWVDSEGFEPSGGEAQKIAIARALYHASSVYILDEPTAALDPNAEYEIYIQFHDMIKDKTAILVTHRLSAVQLADKVAVFDDGQIIEYGTHAELYAKGGKYKEMFDKQSEFYVKSANDIQNETE